MITVWEGPNTTQPHQAAVCDWLRANNIDPESVAPTSPITTDGDVISYRANVLNENGKMQLNEERTEVLREDRTAPLIVPWGGP